MPINLTQFPERPGYAEIAAVIVDGIARRSLTAGERLPPQREMAHLLRVAVATVGRAYARLERQGFVESHVGRGTFIAGGRMRLSDGQPVAEGAVEGLIDLANYRVPVPPLQGDLADALKAILAVQHPQKVLGACPAAGHPDHRAAMAEFVRRLGVAAAPEQVVLTNGGQHAMMAALSTITTAGELVATEAVTDPRMKAVASYLDRPLVAVDLDADGMLPEALDRVCRDQRIAAIFVTPRAHNPTNSTMPLARRAALAEVAARHALPVIESDIYGTILHDEAPPLAALLPEQVYYITSLGRIAGPGMKLGCIVSPAADVARTCQGVAMSTGTATPMLAEIAAHWITEGRLDGMVRWQQAENLRRVSLLEIFAQLRGARAAPGSTHAWLPLPETWRAEEFVSAAEAQGVLIAQSHSFAVRRTPVPHAVRLCIGAPESIELLRTAFARLDRLLTTQPRMGL